MSGGRAVFFAADGAYLKLAWVAARSAAAEPGRDFDVWLLLPEALAATDAAAGGAYSACCSAGSSGQG